MIDSNLPRHWTIGTVELVIHLDLALVEKVREGGGREGGRGRRDCMAALTGIV